MICLKHCDMRMMQSKYSAKLQIELTEAVGKTEKRTYNHEENDEALREELWKLMYDKVYAAARELQCKQKSTDQKHFLKSSTSISTHLPEDTTVNKDLAKHYYHDIQKKASRDLVLNEGVRLDGRKTNEIREIWSEVDYFLHLMDPPYLPAVKHNHLQRLRWVQSSMSK